MNIESLINELEFRVSGVKRT